MKASVIFQIRKSSTRPLSSILGRKCTREPLAEQSVYLLAEIALLREQRNCIAQMEPFLISISYIFFG